MRKPEFINNQIYHIYNRGVEKRDIFSDDKDRFRFIHDLFEFNDEKPAENLYYKNQTLQSYEVEPRKILRKIRSPRKVEPRKLLVEILVFCLMPNHYHLLLRQRKENGIVKFMHKLGTGYTMYFNQRYERTGALFQGRFKAVLVHREEHFIHLPYYIHLNPLDLIENRWKERKIRNYQKAIQFLESYRWSSYLDYTGKKNFPSVTQRDFLLRFLGEGDQLKKNTENWLRETQLKRIKGLLLE